MSRSDSPTAVHAVDSMADELGLGENDISHFLEDNCYLLSLKQDTDGVETVMKKGKLHIDGEKEEFQLQLAKECFDNGILYWGDAQWDMSLAEFRRSLEIREDILGKLNDDTAKGYLWVGSLCWHKMEYERALDFFSRSFRIRMELSSGAKEQCGIVTNWINKALEGQGMENKAIYWKAFLRCIDRERKGDKLRSQGKFEAAMQEYRSSLQLEFSRRGMNVNTPVRPLPDAADLYTKIARLYVAQGDYPRAMMEYRQALRIYMAAFGRHQRFTIQTYQNIAGVGHLMGFQDEFVNRYLACLLKVTLKEKTADSLVAVKDYGGALREFEALLKVEATGLGLYQVQCALIYSKMGNCYFNLGNKEQALTHFAKALGIFDSTLGSQHRHTINTTKQIYKVVGHKAAATTESS